MEKSWGIFIQLLDILSFDLGQPMQWGEAETRILPKVTYFLCLDSVLHPHPAVLQSKLSYRLAWEGAMVWDFLKEACSS